MRRGGGRRAVAGVCVGLFVGPAGLGVAVADPLPILAVDADDTDADGRPDRDQLPAPGGLELIDVDRTRLPSGKLVRAPAEARLLANGRPVAAGDGVPPTARLELQGVKPGRATFEFAGGALHAAVLEVRAYDAVGAPIDFATSHASFVRVPPERLDDQGQDLGDPDAVRFVIVATPDDLPSTLTLGSVGPSGAVVDALRNLALREVPCPDAPGAGLACASTVPLRVVADDVDKGHPLVVDRSIIGALGGGLVVLTPDGQPLQTLRVGGPRETPVGSMRRYRAQLRVAVYRTTPQGAIAVGGDPAGARRVLAGELRRANAVWAACGITFGPSDAATIEILDPPKPHLLALGCDHGLPASGGTLKFRVEGKEVAVRLRPRTTPAAAARLAAREIERLGFVARVSDNLPIGASMTHATDVLVRKRGAGGLATIEPPASGPVSSDRTLTACIGSVDLEDGLQHFGDVDASAGTLEERTLLKAFDDGDPTTIEVVLVPSFAGGGRIGESFISADRGAIRNVVLEDRAGIRADRASFALGHELGHVLLDDPGHPDDFGIDTPSRLMDADAANPSVFGPRRLLVAECARALRQSGPDAPTPLLEPWPFAPLGKEK